jgi:hypothetical protein
MDTTTMTPGPATAAVGFSAPAPDNPAAGSGGEVSMSSVLVRALETMWAGIQGRHPQVPSVGSGSMGQPRGALKLGHFAADRWTTHQGATTAEVFIGGEGLAHGGVRLLATLLHEAAHGLAHARGIKDTSRQGRYHNRRFKTLAIEVGLTGTEDARIGWSISTLTRATIAEYRTDIAALDAAIATWRHPESWTPPTPPTTPTDPGTEESATTDTDPAEPAPRPRNGVVLLCDCGRRIRASTAVADLGSIICGICQTPFTEPTDTDSSSGPSSTDPSTSISQSDRVDPDPIRLVAGSGASQLK